MITLARALAATTLALATWTALAPAALAEELSPEAKQSARDARLQMAQEGLQKLYQLQPEARAAVEKAPGYAVFKVDSVYAVLFVGQKGQGVLFDNAGKAPTFMLSSRVGTGPGVGKQTVYQVFVFKTKGAMEQFVATGSAGADVGASIGTGTDGMVRSFNPSIDIYQVPDSGLAVQASWGGTVYTVDGALE